MAGQHTRRLHPRPWDSQRHILTELRRGIELALERHPDVRDAKRVFDFGCGDKPYAPLWVTRGATYVGGDIDPGADVVIEPGRPVPVEDASFDLVVSFQVLEHVWDLPAYFSEIRRILRSDGRLLLSTHGTWPYHPHPHDWRRWTRDGLVRELEEQGFVVEDVLSCVGPLAWTTQIRLLGYERVLARVPVLGGSLTSALAVAMNARMKLEERATPSAIRDDNAAVYVVIARPTPPVRLGSTEPRTASGS